MEPVLSKILDPTEEISALSLVEVDEINDDAIDLDDLLPKIGEFGLYQKLLLWLVCLPACLPCGFCAFNQLFMTDVPDHWCKVPELLMLNLTERDRKSLSIPHQAGSNSTFEKCLRYKVNWTEVIQSDNPIVVNESWPREPCLNGYEYDFSEVTSSIVIDFDLVCEYDVYPTLGLVALNVGGPIGVYTFGILNDRIGRKKSFFSCLTTLLIGSIMTAFAHAYWIWVLARTIVGLTIPAVYQIPFIICITYLLRDWRALALVTSVPFLFYYFYWFVLPESPRWLLMREKLEEANTILKNIAKVNGKELPEEFTNKLQKLVLEQKENGCKATKNASVFALFKTPNMRLKTCLITLNWCASEMVYVGLSYYGPAIGNNQYMSFFLSSAVEIPSYLGSSNLVLPLVVMGVLSVIGGISCLRLPETLHTSLPQTAEEGEEFGKNWTYKDCFVCGDQRLQFLISHGCISIILISKAQVISMKI
ncbi:unnamed protein product [Diatraea saccharalis]|uniref:Organic cation transporter protein n=1 Tax=Diatraea saccharalis TaxID=40085 RepID=A0A9N9QVQ4_9NEOP|nr:unnamed protein product [Diatraea saccharalis]